MNEQDPTRPTAHESRVAEEEEKRTGGPQLPTDVIAGEPGAPSSEAELEAERRGTTADAIEEEMAEDERTPLDSAYRPKSG